MTYTLEIWDTDNTDVIRVQTEEETLKDAKIRLVEFMQFLMKFIKPQIIEGEPYCWMQGYLLDCDHKTAKTFEGDEEHTIFEFGDPDGDGVYPWQIEDYLRNPT